MTATSPKKKPLEWHFFGLVLYAPYLLITQFTASFSFRANFAPFCRDLLTGFRMICRSFALD